MNKEQITKMYEDKINEGVNVLISVVEESYGRELEENEVQSLLSIYKLGFDSGFQAGVFIVAEQAGAISIDESANLGEGNDETT